MGSLSSNSASNFHGSVLQETPSPHQDVQILELSSDSTYGFYNNLDSWPKDPSFMQENHVFPLDSIDLELLEPSTDGVFKKLDSWPEDPSFLQENQVSPKGYLETTDLDVLEPCNDSKLDYWPKNPSFKKKNQVFLEGYVEASGDEDELVRSKSLTDDDLDELKGCLDLGFGFSYDEIPELCNTLPALELCYSMSQKFMDEQQTCNSMSSSLETTSPASSGPIANWKISSPGDHPEDVKARLKYWAQAVACTVRLCN